MKKKAGKQLVNNIKTSKFLPSIFQTELNKNWLDGTLDQMVSKGPLEELNGYIGNRSGKNSVSTDTYLQPNHNKTIRITNQLKPGPISYDNSKKLTNTITFDDVAHSINDNFETYNYNAAYSSTLYALAPPIDIDKFINYKNYHWVEELPVYYSHWTGASKNPITDTLDITSTITDDQGTISLETGMLIKFTGSGWHAKVKDKTYLVSGCAGKHRVHEYFNTSNNRVYNNTVKHTQATNGIYKNPNIFNVSPNTAYDASTNPAGTTYLHASPDQRVINFNANASRLPIFDGFLFDAGTGNPTQLANSIFVKFTGSWTHSAATNNTDTFSVTVDPVTGDVAITAATAKELAGLHVSPGTIAGTDQATVMYNKGHPVTPLKDYIVVAKHDAFQSAWSRANHWVNISTINKLQTLLPNYDFSEILNPNRIALRPIIEYEAGLNLWNCAEHDDDELINRNKFKGAVDYGVTAADSVEIAAFATGTTYVYIDNTDLKLHTVGASPAFITLDNNKTFSIKNVANNINLVWKDADVFVEGGVIKLAQQKVKINEYPLFRFYNQDGRRMENVDGVGFSGGKLFGYKEGTGTVLDTELNQVLSFKDTPKGGEYEFENFIITKKYLNSFAHVENDNLSHTKDQFGYTLFKHNDILTSIYKPSGKEGGAREHLQYEITAGDTDLAIPYGQNNWRPTQQYYIHSDKVRYSSSGQQLAITIVNGDGIENTARAGSTEFYLVGVGHTFVFNNVTSDAITFSAQSEITTTTVGAITTVVTSANSNDKQFDVSIGGKLLQTFYISDKWDKLYHKTTVNGKEVLASQETITATGITVNNSILKAGDIVDFYWNNNSLTNKTTNTSLPDVLDHNVHNTPLSTFTISETIEHWASKLNAMPNFNGKTFSANNYASIPHIPFYGGTIFMSTDTGIMNDINYSDNNLSITGALNEQANDYVGFRNRVMAQARRIYSTSGATTVQGLTDKAIQQVIKNKHIDGLYKESNMLYTQTDDTQSFTTTNATTKGFKTRYIFNGDLNIRDHVYVYQTVSSIRTLLLKDTDYTIMGDTVTLTTAAATGTVIEVYYSQMDEPCYIPPSMVKLGLANGYEPHVSNNILFTHDGMQIDVTGKDVSNINAGATFDPVNAVILEMERRIFTGLVRQDTMYGFEGRDRFACICEFLPSPHVTTWYTINNLNNYLEKYYYQWANHNKIKSLNKTGYYDSADSFTWNYSTINAYEDFGTTLPGHYQGAYTHLFGTCTPHITPWHMLGFGLKPIWWDQHYSWLAAVTATAGAFTIGKRYKIKTAGTTDFTLIGAANSTVGTIFTATGAGTGSGTADDTRRDDLKNAVKKGITSNPVDINVVQNMKHVRHNWDYETRCPVTTTGALENPSTVLDPNGNVTNVAKEAAFVFGDWGPVEIDWRLSANGQAMLVDAVTKLVPAKAWSAFFQPGFINRSYSKIANVGRYNYFFPASKDYKLTGEVYGSSIFELKVTGTHPPATLERTGSFKILDDYDSTLAKARYNINGNGATGSISSISLIERGLDFTGSPVLSYVGTAGAATGICVDIELKEIPFVANGIAQAQYNYLRRHQHNISQRELYGNLTTKLQEKLSGFTSKHLLDISADSSLTGDFELGEDDFNVEMYKGAVTDSVTASAVIIEKMQTGWKIIGMSDNNREFKFFEPNLAKATNYETQTIANQQVRRYNDFVTTASIAEYDTMFEKVQDTYNFIRGYWEWMRTSGYTVQYDGDSSAADFVTWALTAEVSNLYILQIGRELKFKPAHGHVYEYNELEYNSNSVLDTKFEKIQNSDLSISRTDGTVNIETKNKEFIGSITSAIVDYEHVIIFENKTKLGVHLFDDVKNRRQERLLVRGQRTSNWTGEKKAPGYLVVDNHIVQNFDSAVQSVDDIYRTDVNEFNQAFTKAKDLTIGNIEGQLLDGLGLDKNVLTSYYQGVIKEKGTKGAIQHIGKSSLLSGESSSVSAFEQFMFRQSTLGNSNLEDPLEIELVSADINSSPQTVSLMPKPTVTSSVEANVIYKSTANTVNDNAGTKIPFKTLSYRNSATGILTGGETLSTETKYQVENSDSIINAFDKKEAYAKIPTWNNFTSYKKGDQVRHEGKLLSCAVDYTGLTIATDTIEVLGTTTSPYFPYGTVVNIAGLTSPNNVLQHTTTQYTPIVATGAVANPTFLPSTTLTINGTTIPFTKTELVNVITGPAVILGNTNTFSLVPVTGESIVINGTTVNFDTTPVNVVQNFTGDASTVAFTLTQALSGSTYSLSTLTVGGVAMADPADYSISGQVITFATAPAASAAIVATLVHIPNQITTGAAVRDIITAANITGITAELNATGQLKISYANAGDATARLLIAAGSTNAKLGLPATPSPSNGTLQITTLQPVPALMTVTEIKDQIVIASASNAPLTNIVATVNGSNNLVLTSADNNGTALTITPLATANILGLYGHDSVNQVDRTLANSTGVYATPTTTVQLDMPVGIAVDTIQAMLTAASITAVTVTLAGTQIKVSSTEASLVMGSTTFNDLAGLSTGTVTSISSTVVNVFNSSKWSEDTTDNALYNILVTNDSDFGVESSGSVVTKFFGWNVLQVQQATTPLWTKPDANRNTTTGSTTCGICAGTMSKDGNDAEVTTQVDHGLQVGDFVQLLNTTTTPNIDGVHKITKLGTGVGASKIFYIDEYIQKCGNAVSVNPLVTTRIMNETQRNAAVASTRWNLPVGTLVFMSNLNDVRGTYVYKTEEGNTWTAIRTTTQRPTNTDIDSVVIYNHKENVARAQLETWDPMRSIIPGIAQQNLDYINVSDNAIYTTSSDAGQLTDPDTCWSDEQLGTRWWDTSKVRYYDYDQGTTAYKSSMWGKLYPGSEVVVWEWIKSAVAPDDYADAVKNNTEMFGQVATGEAFSVYDTTAEEYLYYYTLDKQWNTKTNSYNDVYYYWVKDKTTISDTRTLSAFDVANIIESPTAQGVSWFAAIGPAEFIIDNIQYYIDDKNTVIQINIAGDKYKSHNEWTLIAKDCDLIPEYYINGMRQNLAGRDKAKNILPFQALHRFNRFGDDTVAGQTWFNDLTAARRNAAVTINMLLQHINLDQEYKDTWDRTFKAESFPKRLWTWHDYKLASYTGSTTHTTTVNSYADLDNLDRDLHVIAKISVFDTGVQRNRSEIYAYNTVTKKWDLVLKKNITIQLNVGLLTLEGGWDIGAFDSTPFDQANIAKYWEDIITALQKDIFVHYNISNMNKLFFSIINHTLSSFTQTNWVRKTTYIKLEFNNTIDSITRKYKKDKISNALGYIQEVKPFHTKVNSIVAKYAPAKEATINLATSESLRINVQTNTSGSTLASATRTFVHIQDNAGVVKAYALQESKRTTITLPLSVSDTTITATTIGNDFGAFSATGFAYINGELIEFAKGSATLLNVTTRGVSGTFATTAAIGDSITEVVGLTFSNPATTLQYQALNEEILTSSSVLAQELQGLTQGIAL